MIRDDGITESRATREPIDEAAPEPMAKAKHALDKPKARKILTKLREWWDQEWDRQAHNRYQMAMDEDYYDGLQWSEEDALVLMERGQAPCVYNEIKPAIDWMLGTERRTRIDYKVLPRRKEGSKDAEVKTQVMKYLSDVNHTPMHRSKAFEQSIKAGLGWLEVGVKGDDTEPIYSRAQSWRQMLYDSNSTELDLSDARYLFRWRYVDLDIAEAYFPERKAVLRRSVIDGSDTGRDDDEDIWYMGARVTEPGRDFSSPGKYRPYDGAAFSLTKRERVKLIEAWYREPRRVQVNGGEGDSSVHDRAELEVRVAIYCDAGLLWEGQSPYTHNRFPFVPIWAYRRSRDNAPYGAVRQTRDPQDGVNKRASKAIWILSTNQIEMEEGAVDDIDELREEASRPDAVIVRKRGKEMTIHRDNALADQHIKLMENDRMMIRLSSGVTDENLGRQTNAHSGKAIIARQEQGSVVTTELFDNLRYAIQMAGEIELSLVEQYYTDERVIRLVGDRGQASFVEINTQDPQTGETLNDITAMKADFVVSQQDYRDSLRIAMFESLFDITGRLAQMAPEIAFKLLDLVVEMADIPNRDEIVSRIRGLNGMRDPESEPTPEEQAQMQQQAQMEAIQQEMAMAGAQAQLAEQQGKAEKVAADAVAAKLGAMKTAIDSAQLIAASPGAAPMADDLMAGAGYQPAG